MHPVLFSFGQFHLYSFGLMVSLGVMLSLFLMERRAQKNGFPKKDMIFDLVFVAVLSGFLGGRIAYVIENFGWYLKNPAAVFAVWEGGLIFYGGMITSFLAVVLYGRAKKISPAALFDFLLPFVSLSHAFGRLGCFLNGCCGGRTCSLPWAVRFPDTEAPVHPTQIYEFIWDMVLFLFLSNYYEKNRARTGMTTVLYFFLYGLGRFTVEFFRAGNPFWGPLTANQWTSLFIMAASAVFFAAKKGKPAHGA